MKRCFDKQRVVLIFGEDDGFAEPVAAFDLDAVLHQMSDDEVDRIGIEQPLVDLGCLDSVGDLVLAPFQHVPLVFFVLAQVVVA